jgi:hypothetical protein
MKLFWEIIGPASILVYLSGAFSPYFDDTVKNKVLLKQITMLAASWNVQVQTETKI